MAGPRIATVRAAAMSTGSLRLDAGHYQEEFVLARNRVLGSGFEVKTVESLVSAFVPSRMKLITGTSPSAGPPYLKAHDAFDTLPSTSRYMASARTPDAESYQLEEGMLLTPSSGRNLGPFAHVGKYLSRFAMTDIMRITPRSGDVGMFLLAYLMTDTGQALIRRGRTGTTVDHLSPDDVMEIPVAWVDDATRRASGETLGKAEMLLDQARLDLDKIQTELHWRLGLPLPLALGQYRSATGAKVFELSATSLGSRIDSAYYDPTVARAKKLVLETGGTGLLSCADSSDARTVQAVLCRPGSGASDFVRQPASATQTSELEVHKRQVVLKPRVFRSPPRMVSLYLRWSKRRGAWITGVRFVSVGRMDG